MKKKDIYLVLFIIVFMLFVKKSFSQTDESVRAMWIFNIASGIEWEDGDNKEFVIGVFSSQKEYNEIKKLATKRKIKGKAVEVIQYSNYSNIKPNHIVYVTKNENANLGFVYQKLKEKNVLIISDRSHQPDYSVINLNNTANNQPFVINCELLDTQKLIASKSLLRIGGDRNELKKIQVETNKRLLEEKKRLSEIQKDIELKDKEIEVLKEKLRECEERNKNKK